MNLPQLVDTHLHLDDEQLRHDPFSLIERAKAAGVDRLVTIGTDAGSSERCVKLAARFPEVFAAVGIQPNYVAEAAADDWTRIVALSTQPRVVAIGETGLDHYWNAAPAELQEAMFERHVRLAHATGLPFVVHMREPKEPDPTFPCSQQILTCLNHWRAGEDLRGVMHSYTGNLEYALHFLDLGLHISFAGMVTYKNAEDLRAVAREIPAERLLVETDAPYLSPHPVRGKRPNEPQYLIHTAACLAEVRGVSVEELARLTSINAEQLFGLSRDL